MVESVEQPQQQDPEEVMEEQDRLLKEHEDEEAGVVPEEDEDDVEPSSALFIRYPAPAEEDWAERTVHPPSPPYIARSRLSA